MDAKARKLAIKIEDTALAEALVKAGYDSPAKLRAATDTALEAVKGVGPATRKALRRRFPRR